MDEFFNSENTTIDELTQLHDRDVIVRYIDSLITKRTPFSMALVDIDNFKFINDSYGSEVGDAVLREAADLVKKQIGENGHVGRFDGDEFIVVMPGIVNYDGIWQYCHKILVSISEAEFSSLNGSHVTATVGLARFPENASSYDRLLEAVRKALYRGKVKGRNCFIIYLPEKHANIIVKTAKDKQLSSMYLHSIVFNHLSKTENLGEGIKSLFDFIGSYYNIDHLCIQESEKRGNKLYFERIGRFSKNTEFKPIKLDLVKENLNKTVEVFSMNDVKSLLQSNHIELYELLCEQNITSACFVTIAYQKEFYGILRAEIVGVPGASRIWQYGDMDILLTIAKTIAIILHFTGKTIKEL